MGELKHGIYDDECVGLTGEEINVFYDFEENGESVDEIPDQLDEERDEDSGYDDGHLEELEVDNAERNEPGSEDNVINLHFIESLT